jgi:hypothetical protein
MVVWLFLHILGFGLWLGGGIALLLNGLAADKEGRPALALILRLQGGIARMAVAPGALLATLSGLMLTFGNIHAPQMGNPWMATMQGAGILAALLTLAVSVPAAARLARLDPMGQHAAFVDRMRKRQRMVGMLSLALGLLALLGGAMYRYGG